MPYIFVSKSGSFPADAMWPLFKLRAKFGLQSAMTDADFRLGQDPLAIHEGWQSQFQVTRDCNVMVVLLDPVQWTSDGQDVETEDASGRGVPLALCRVLPFRSEDDNDRFVRLVARGGPSGHRWSLLGFFDLCRGEDVERLLTWVERAAAVPPPRIPAAFQSNVPTPFTARIRVPEKDVWDYMDWSGDTPVPQLVFNYGERLVRDERKARREWEWPEKRQVVVPLTATAVRGELAGTITLPHRGFGHALLTIGPPTDKNHSRPEDRLMWWDFFVDIK
jgi:hypothetical protein